MVGDHPFLRPDTRFQGTDTKSSPHYSVLDLPQLYIRPPARSLLSALEYLAIKPSSWDTRDDWQEHEGGEIGEDGVPKYLTSIIASPLAWIEDEEVKEQIWEAAGARLSERSGRTGRPRLSVNSLREDIHRFAVTDTWTYSDSFHFPYLHNLKNPNARINTYRPTDLDNSPRAFTHRRQSRPQNLAGFLPPG